jgi:hypothetical protein
MVLLFFVKYINIHGINPNKLNDTKVTIASLIGCSSILISPNSSIIMTSTKTFLFFAKVSVIITASS